MMCQQKNYTLCNLNLPFRKNSCMQVQQLPSEEEGSVFINCFSKHLCLRQQQRS